MKVIITGSKSIVDHQLLLDAIEESCYTIEKVVSGGSRGVDSLGESWALKNNVPIQYFFPNWSTHGKAAGPIRNSEMAEYSDALIAIWDGNSGGTFDIINQSRAANLKVYIKRIDE